MIAEISIHPQVGRDIRQELVQALEEIEAAGLAHEVDAFGTAMEADLEQILSVVRAMHTRLANERVERFEIHLRLRQETQVRRASRARQRAFGSGPQTRGASHRSRAWKE
ncbi:MAG: thiamine-binding protein [Actinomycetota bacterium]|nr:thiamine-binding protein [Actinomycetota bacterium]MDP9304305.1 thiamine-binding protein [Actinomycetota bacterium]